MKKLGATHSFSDSADFSGMTKSNGIYISKVIHQAVVDINEEGTEAAAATAVVIMEQCAIIEKKINFVCNRPFIFIIHEKKKNATLFYGKYVKPN